MAKKNISITNDRSNNLKEYQTQKLQLNMQLVEDAILEICKFGAEITFENVAQFTKNLALQRGDKFGGLTKQALYKNQEYKNTILKNKMELNKDKLDDFHKTRKVILDEADLTMLNFELRQKNIKLENENRLLKHTLKNINGDVSNQINTQENTNTQKGDFMAKKKLEIVLKTLKLKKLLEIHKETLDLKLVMHGDILLDHKSAVEIFGEDFIDEIRHIEESYVY